MTSYVYADFAASTPTDSRVVKAMEPFFADTFGNPSSIHSVGTEAARAISEARTQISNFLGCNGQEVIFTSGGTESNNLAILGVAKANKHRGHHIITTAIEHPSVLNACRALEREGFEISYLPVQENGLVDPKQLQKALTKKTILVSIHLANSEIGVVQPLQKLAAIIHKIGAYFHTDACQAGAFLNLDVQKLGVDLLTFNGSKMYGPKGTGVLYVKEAVQIFPIMFGGGQQESLRSGTEHVPGIVGLAKACQIATQQRESDSKNIGKLRDELHKSLEVAGCVTNVAKSPKLPNHLSVIVPTDTTNVVEAMDSLGVAVSSGSACSSKSLVESQVLQALSLSSEQINRTIRISLGRQTTATEVASIARAVKTLKKSP